MYVRLSCNATGNPKPRIAWYRNGKLLNVDWIVTYDETRLLIPTYEERHKGIYQCVATNVAGEAQVTGLLSWIDKTYTQAPKNVKCLPLNATSMKVQFEVPGNFKVWLKNLSFSRNLSQITRIKNERSIIFVVCEMQWSGVAYYMASKQPRTWTTSFDLKLLGNEFIVMDKSRPPYTPIMLYLRGMERTGFDTKSKGSINNHYAMSMLSEGIKCATQGCKYCCDMISPFHIWQKKTINNCTLSILNILPFPVPVHGKFSPNGIFIWWPKVEHINVTSYLIQFKNEERTAMDRVVGTTRTIDDFETWENISDNLNPIPATTNIHPSHENGDDSNDTKSVSIVELRIDGNISGILIPNKHEIIVRVLVPIIDEDGELEQDLKYVEWKKVRSYLFWAELKTYELMRWLLFQ